jgi:regulator of sirC expression with transglutaminase-like and TPR domain
MTSAVSSSISEPPSTDWSQLPFLLRLMDDPSPAVRAKIAERLRTYGDEVWSYLAENDVALTAAQRHALREILARRPQSPATSQWPDWLRLRGENERLEAAFGWLSRRNHNGDSDEQLRKSLDRLAHAYLQQGGSADPEELSTFLFTEYGLQGAEGEDYLNPRASDLLCVLEDRRGLPISLACIFALTGWRLDIAIYGCNFPGHFLARAPLTPGEASEDDLIFDPYNRGRVLRADETRALRKAAPQALCTPASAREIIARVLRNLANAHYQRHQQNEAREVLQLLAALDE